MITNDRTTSDITKKIFREVARLTWNGELDAKKELLPEMIIPGPLPQFRCCIYREREIIRLRFGLEGSREYTQKEVADLLGISQSYISRLEKRILTRLRREMMRLLQV